MAKQSKKIFHNTPPVDLPDDIPVEQVKIQFGSRLQKAMIQKGWNQSELAAEAAKHLPEDKKKGKPLADAFGRDKISMYIRGRTLPSPVYLRALCKALGTTPEELLPTRGRAAAAQKAPSLDFRQMEDGNVFLRVNQAVSMETAIEIVAILKKDNENQ